MAYIVYLYGTHSYGTKWTLESAALQFRSIERLSSHTWLPRSVDSYSPVMVMIRLKVPNMSDSGHLAVGQTSGIQEICRRPPVEAVDLQPPIEARAKNEQIPQQVHVSTDSQGDPRPKYPLFTLMEIFGAFPYVKDLWPRGGWRKLGKETTLGLFRQQKPGRESQHAMAKGKGECQQRPPNTTPTQPTHGNTQPPQQPQQQQQQQSQQQ